MYIHEYRIGLVRILRGKLGDLTKHCSATYDWPFPFVFVSIINNLNFSVRTGAGQPTTEICVYADAPELSKVSNRNHNT